MSFWKRLFRRSFKKDFYYYVSDITYRYIHMRVDRDDDEQLSLIIMDPDSDLDFIMTFVFTRSEVNEAETDSVAREKLLERVGIEIALTFPEIFPG